MKTKMIFLALVVMILNLNTSTASVEFKGTSNSAAGDISDNCRDIKDRPKKIEAENDSKEQAREFCDTFSKKSVKVSPFKYEDLGCLKEGRGFATHTVLRITASALYNCK